MQDFGKVLFFLGLGIAAVGLMLWLGKGFRLPGDIYVEKGTFSFGFPVVTCIVISLLLTLLWNIFRR